MSSPASEIVVSNEPPPSSPVQTMSKSLEPVEPEEMSLDTPVPPPTDPTSKKSFKRKYRKLLRRYREIRATNGYLHSTYSKATRVSSQLSNENANILDFLVGMEQRLPLTETAKKAMLDNDLPSEPVDPAQFDYDAHFGYSPTPSPPPEVANQLTQEQIDMSMFKVEPGSSGSLGTMGPPQPVIRDESVDAFKGKRPSGRTSAVGLGVFPSSRKRKDRDSEGEDNGGSIGRKKTRG